MVLAKTTTRTLIYKDGATTLPALPLFSLNSAIVAGPQRISVAASANNVAIPITNKGTIKALFIWTDDATTTLTIKVNGSNAFNASDFRIYGTVSSLTVSNSNTTDAGTLNIMVITT
jgi:hypothetical protein